MPEKNKRCTATTAAGNPCKKWSLLTSTVCAAHAGKLGARPGNSNAVKHAFYRPSLTADEIAALITHAENTSLDDELAITRVMLRRLMHHLKQPGIPPEELAAIAPLIFTGSRTVAKLLREISETGKTSDTWSEILDQMSADLGIQL